MEVKARKTSLLMIIWIIGYWIGYFWSTLIHFEIFYVTLNERDFIVFAPFFAVLAAIGLGHISKFLFRNRDNLVAFCILFSIGVASLSQSLLVNEYGPTILRNALNSFTGLFGTTMNSLTLQIPRENIVQSIPNIFFFILFINMVIIVLPIFVKKSLYPKLIKGGKEHKD